MKVTPSANKGATSQQKKNSSKKIEDENLFTRLLGLGGIEKNEKTENVQEVNKLGDFLTAENRGELDELIGEIDQAGKDFIQKPLYANLVKYKLSLQKFMGIIIQSAYDVQQRVGRKSINEEKIYSIVKKVNEELETLSENVLNNNKSALNLVSKFDEIRGLLIDLYK